MPKKKSKGDWEELGFKVGTVFRPATPVNRYDLFAGRRTQIHKVVDTVNQPGLHAILFGERGVGKTSLSNILPWCITCSGSQLLIPRINCLHGDTFSDIWRRVFEETLLVCEEKEIELPSVCQERMTALTEDPIETVTTDHVRRSMTEIGRDVGIYVVVVDEFDVVTDDDTRRSMADTIKFLSDRNVPATVVLIGVADDIEKLIQNHRSVERCLCQIPMPRMSRDEIEEIVVTGLQQIEMLIEPPALHEISRLSRGLPHYAHLLGLHSGRAAVARESMIVMADDMVVAVSRAIDEVQASTKREYNIATTSARKDAIYRQVLLAAALAECDDLGYFYPNDVRPMLSKIIGEPKKTDSFARHLNSFCSPKRGSILERDIRTENARYRFSNPLLQPYVLIRGLAEQQLTVDVLRETRSPADKVQKKLF